MKEMLVGVEHWVKKKNSSLYFEKTHSLCWLFKEILYFYLNKYFVHFDLISQLIGLSNAVTQAKKCLLTIRCWIKSFVLCGVSKAGRKYLRFSNNHSEFEFKPRRHLICGLYHWLKKLKITNNELLAT